MGHLRVKIYFSEKKKTEKIKRFKKLGGSIRTQIGRHMTPRNFSDWSPDSSLNDIFRCPSKDILPWFSSEVIWGRVWVQNRFRWQCGTRSGPYFPCGNKRRLLDRHIPPSMIGIGCGFLHFCDFSNYYFFENRKNIKMDAKYPCKNFDHRIRLHKADTGMHISGKIVTPG